MSEQVEFLDELAGQGFEHVTGADRVTPLLKISQQMSTAVVDGKVPSGVFFNGQTLDNYGPELDVIFCYYDRFWYEWLPEQAGLAGRYPVGGVEVDGDSYSGLVNSKTGNKIEEKMVFLVYLPEHPEAGPLVFSSTPGTMKLFKQLMSKIETQRLPSGKRCPMFGAVWHLKLGMLTNKQNKKYYGPTEFTFKDYVNKDVFVEGVKPIRDTAVETIGQAQIDDKTQTQALPDNADVQQPGDVNF